MKPKEQRYLELYEHVRALVEVSETETRLSKLFPQTKFQVGEKGAAAVSDAKTKNVGKKGKYHAVIKMKTSSVIQKPLPTDDDGNPIEPESPLNNGMQSPEESIRGMRDIGKVAQDLLSQGLSPDDVVAQLVAQGVEQEEAMSIIQQLSAQQNPKEALDKE